MNTEWPGRNQKLISLCLRAFVVKPVPNSPRRHEDAKNHEAFSISLEILSKKQRIFGLVVRRGRAPTDKSDRRAGTHVHAPANCESIRALAEQVSDRVQQIRR